MSINSVAGEIKEAAERQGLCVIACTADEDDYSPYGAYLDCPAPEVPDLVKKLGIPVVLLTRVVFDASLYAHGPAESAAAHHDGEVSQVYVGFSYEGREYWARSVAGWLKAIKETDAAVEAEPNSSARGRYTPFEPPPFISNEEEQRLVEFAVNHETLKDIPAGNRSERERRVRGSIEEIAAEIDIKFPETDGGDNYRMRRLVADVCAKIADAQLAAFSAVEDDLDRWATQVIAAPDFSAPSASQREQCCKNILEEHLGFRPPKTLCERLRKHADGVKRSAGSLF